MINMSHWVGKEMVQVHGASGDGLTITSSYVSVNTTAGFSIVKYTGNGTAGAYIHGL